MPIYIIETVEDRKKVNEKFLKNRSLLKQKQLQQKLRMLLFKLVKLLCKRPRRFADGLFTNGLGYLQIAHAI